MVKFEKSNRKDKKYSVITPEGKKIHFGNKKYEHFKDTTGLGLYRKLNHNDKKRQKNYQAFHESCLCNGTSGLIGSRHAFKHAALPPLFLTFLRCLLFRRAGCFFTVPDPLCIFFRTPNLQHA